MAVCVKTGKEKPMLFTINRKMKNSTNEKYKKIVNFTIPAFITKDGIKTCPNAGSCATGCYARMGAYVWPKVYAKHRANLDATMSDEFIDIAIAELTKVKPQLVRIHDSGDFYSEEYFTRWYVIAKLMPHIQFYAYTKMVDMVKKFILPDNLCIIYSLGGKQDHLIDQTKDRHSRVFETLDQLQALGYVDTSKDDTLALGINPKIGLVYHGNKSYSNTLWDKVSK